MTPEEILKRVRDILSEEFELEPSRLAPEARLYEELGLDSLDSVDLVVALEKSFGFKIVRSEDEERIRAIRSVQDVCDFVSDKREAAGPAA